MSSPESALPVSDPSGNPYVKPGRCPYCGEPERKGGQRVGYSIPFECGTVLRWKGGGHGLVAYDARDENRSDDCHMTEHANEQMAEQMTEYHNMVMEGINAGNVMDDGSDYD